MKKVFVNAIVFVKDINGSKDFYANVLGMEIEQDYGTIVFFRNHLVLHSADSIITTVFKKKRRSAQMGQGKRNLLLYFETDDLEAFYNQVSSRVKIIHGIEEQAWGQRVFRFYDPDQHMIEFGEPFRVKELMSRS